MALVSLSFIQHSVDFYFFYLKTFDKKTIYIYNIYNSYNFNIEDKYSSTIPTLFYIIEKHLNREYILLRDYNLYHLR